MTPSRQAKASPPKPKADPLAIVGVGASAGGLKACTEFLDALSGRADLAVVVVLHLDPSRESSLPKLLLTHTSMPVVEARDGVEIEPNTVYTILPNTALALSRGRFETVEPRPRVPVHDVIDRFFSSLAFAAKERAIGVVLSGTASDGSAGIRAIKASGGSTFAQDLSAEYPGMPESAIRSGYVDKIGTPAAIAKDILALVKSPWWADPTRPGPATHEKRAGALAEILDLLKGRMGIDFSAYKPNTLHRRILRRMALAGIDDAEEYRRRLVADPKELGLLHDDVLINVTAFFRDPDCYQALQDLVVPALLSDPDQTSPIRVWVPGCSTGQEAYSIAMMLIEAMDGFKERRPIQIFATDIDESAIAFARRGLYDERIRNELSPARLRRFFSLNPSGGYEISRSLRDTCLFARHDLTRDPPFPKLDLISCRNVLIYLGPPVQERILSAFHFALKPNRFLFLGPSETVERGPDLFLEVDKKHRIFAQNPAAAGHRVARPFPGGIVPRRAGKTGPAKGPPRVNIEEEANRVVLTMHAPPGVVVDEAGRVLHMRGDLSLVLQPAMGKPEATLRRLFGVELQAAIDEALREARRAGQPVRKERIRYRIARTERSTAVAVYPLGLGDGKDALHLVLFEPGGVQDRESKNGDGQGTAERTLEELAAENARLRQALASQSAYHQGIIRTLEATNEEFLSAQEELVSANEEFQSTNEELETAKEEVQSSNEELLTVNEQLRSQNDEVRRLNGDLQNVLSGLQIPVLILDGELRIKRMTAPAQRLFNAIPSDVNRRITDLKSNLPDLDLEAMFHASVDELRVIETETEAADGRWYSARMRPYRTVDQRIDGALLVLVDIDAEKRAEISQEKARAFSDAIISTVRDPFLILDGDLRVVRANQAFFETFQMTVDQVKGRLLHDVGAGEWNALKVRELFQDPRPSGSEVRELDLEQEFAGIGTRFLRLYGRKLALPDGNDRLLLGIEDVTQRRLAAAEMMRLKQMEIDQLQRINQFKVHFINAAAHELSNPLTPLKLHLFLLKNEMDPAAPPKLHRALDIIEQSTEQVETLVRDMREAAKYQSGRLQLNKTPVDIGHLVASAVDQQRSALAGAGLTIETEIGTGIEAPVDPKKITQVLQNLLSNAVKYVPKGGKVTVRVERVDDRARVVVQDTGIGISARGLERLFQPFERVHDRSTKVPGTGLGLYICRGIVELHRGMLRAESPGPGQGSTFILELPLRPADEADEGSPDASD